MLCIPFHSIFILAFTDLMGTGTLLVSGTIYHITPCSCLGWFSVKEEWTKMWKNKLMKSNLHVKSLPEVDRCEMKCLAFWGTLGRTINVYRIWISWWDIRCCNKLIFPSSTSAFCTDLLRGWTSWHHWKQAPRLSHLEYPLVSTEESGLSSKSYLVNRMFSLLS